MDAGRKRGQLPDYYAALSVGEHASFQEIEAAYWREAMRNREALPLLNEAYEMLGDAQRRADYNAQRAASAPGTTATRDEPPPPKSSRLGKLQGLLGRQ